MAHKSVLQVAVAGRLDERAGEVPVAFVKTRKAVEEADLLLHCRQQLTDYKVPQVLYRSTKFRLP